MHVVAESLDDLLLKVYKRLLRKKNVVEPTKGETVEEFGNLLKLNNPRARLSRTETKGTIFSCLGEFLWYMASSNSLEFIQHYLKRYDEFSDDGLTVHGAYGPRLFNMKGIDQVSYIIDKLRHNGASRKAVIQLFDATDVNADPSKEYKDVPCTCTLQFVARRGKLHMIANMRSNDAYLGLSHDIFSFTMLQELIARSLEIELGDYQHLVGSLHLYTRDQLKVERFISEGLQDDIPMPAMPRGDPWPSIRAVLRAEEAIRLRNDAAISTKELDPYWADIVRLLQIHGSKNPKDIVRLKNDMHSKQYENYIRKRQSRKQESPSLPLF
jgi:thymidylate synthase